MSSSVAHSDTLAHLATAKAKAQAKFLPLGKDKRATVSLKAGGSYSYAYSDLASCLESVMPALSAEGIALFQPVRTTDAGAAIATTLLVHGESGEWIASDYAVPAVDPSDPRSVGSAASYARRYGLCAMLGIAPADEDDDAADARGGDHEMSNKPAARAPASRPTTPDQESPPCPACGQHTLRPSKYERGGWYCSKPHGGCGKAVKTLPAVPVTDDEEPPF